MKCGKLPNGSKRDQDAKSSIGIHNLIIAKKAIATERLKMPEPVVKLCGNLLTFYCPGCKMIHAVEVITSVNGKKPSWTQPKWPFNGDIYNPTIIGNSSIRVRDGKTYCHFLIKKGKIIYWCDNPHKLNNCVIEMIAIDKWFKDIECTIVSQISIKYWGEVAWNYDLNCERI